MNSFKANLSVLGVAIALLLVTFAAGANNQVELKSEQIKELLSDQYVKGIYKGRAWTSFFDSNGDTSYSEENGRPSNGRWKVEGDRYCSQWPPSATWDCYVVTAEGDELTFVPEGGGAKWPASRVVKN